MPRTVAMSVARTATTSEVITAFPSPGQANGFIQPSSENSFQA